MISSHGAVSISAAAARPSSVSSKSFLLPSDSVGGQQALVDQQLQGGVHRTGARLPQLLTAFVDLLDHLVAVHGPLDEQREDRGAHVAALAAGPAAAGTPRGPPRTGPRGRSRSRSRGRTRAESAAGAVISETRTEAGVAAVFAEVIAEFAPGLPPVFVQRRPILRAEAEAEPTGFEGAFEGVKGVFIVVSFLQGAPMRSRYVDDISETIAMQRLVRDAPSHRATTASAPTAPAWRAAAARTPGRRGRRRRRRRRRRNPESTESLSSERRSTSASECSASAARCARACAAEISPSRKTRSSAALRNGGSSCGSAIQCR